MESANDQCWTPSAASGGHHRQDLANFPADTCTHPQEKQPAPQSPPAEVWQGQQRHARHEAAVTQPPAPVLPREIGGRDGPEPTRFGDWEKAGRCIDF